MSASAPTLSEKIRDAHFLTGRTRRGAAGRDRMICDPASSRSSSVFAQRQRGASPCRITRRATRRATRYGPNPSA
jgi:hypothetical protein